MVGGRELEREYEGQGKSQEITAPQTRGKKMIKEE